MKNCEKYGSLTDKDFREFLSEIEIDDDTLESETEKTESEIAEIDEKDQISELPENEEIEARYGNDAWRTLTSGLVLYSEDTKEKAKCAIAQTYKEKAKRNKSERTRIQQMAFRQNDIDMSEKIGNDNIKLLIRLLTIKHVALVEKYEAFINRRLTALLLPLIPLRLRTAQSFYPKSIRLSPGFIYKAKDENGEELLFWASPNIPYYFEQNTEQDVLRKNQKRNFLSTIDNAVCMYYKHKRTCEEKELKYASKLLSKNITTYFELLRENPFWFELLYNELIKK